MADTFKVEVELTDVMDEQTILLGYSIGSAELDEGRKLDIIGSGKTVRFTVIDKETGKRVKEYDLNLMPIAVAVVDR